MAGPLTAPSEFDPAAVAALFDLGRANGLDAIGVTTADPLDRARRALDDRRRRQLDGGLPFTYRNPVRSTTPGMAVEGARSVIVGARSYLGQDIAKPTPTSARIARYSWVDHYEPLRAGLRAVAKELKLRGWRAVVFADDNTVVDREVAWRAGVGWYGKNANLLLPKAGSWFVLGCVITTAELPPAQAPVSDGCGSCRRCFDGCPTSAIIEPGVIDANRCLAWLLQRPGIFPLEYRVALGDRLYGCDDCQEVCPPNARFGRVRPDPERRPQAWADVLDLLEGTDAEILDQFGRWYIHQREPRWLRRNALVILGNIGHRDDLRTCRILASYLHHDEAMLRAHAVWAARRLHLDHLVDPADSDEDVQVEIDRPAGEVR